MYHYDQSHLNHLLNRPSHSTGWRFLLGVGCGGVYPLAATITAESSSSKEDRGKLVALTFSMQGVGYLTVSVVAYVLVWILGEESDLAWRMLLGLGCTPGLALICFRIHHRKGYTGNSSQRPASTDGPLCCASDKVCDDEQRQTRNFQKIRLDPTSLLEQILKEPNLFRKMLGTAGCWLLFDILFYGNTLFQPVVLSAAFGSSETILATVGDSTLLSLMALPGYFVSVAMVGRQNPKTVQFQGFLIMSVLYTFIGMNFSELARNRIVLLSMYGLTFFFSNYGPNSTVSEFVTCSERKGCADMHDLLILMISV